ncbi:hypothetical protein GCM10025876_33970 [Demequina litorisediminis]|uniref:Uncharacterized protein n=2 Tax=Demequina litorisediminis TaxID=1849022 RepID=A0ABQ6IH46_9MICO|nr:hypothetical protein GCM10025876_33970 [Demequina litorisediminis]
MWAAIYPLILGAQALLSPLTRGWPGEATTALVLALVVPVAMLVTVPWLSRLAARAMRAGEARS